MWNPHERQGRKKIKRTRGKDESASTLAWLELRSWATWATLSGFAASWEPPGNTYRDPGTDASHLRLWEDLSFRYPWMGEQPWKETSLSNSKLQNYSILFSVFATSWLEASRTLCFNISITAARKILAVLHSDNWEFLFFFVAINGHKKMSIIPVLKSSFLTLYCAGHVFVGPIVCSCTCTHLTSCVEYLSYIKSFHRVTPGHT